MMTAVITLLTLPAGERFGSAVAIVLWQKVA